MTPTTLAEALHRVDWPDDGPGYDVRNDPICPAKAAALLALPPEERAALAAALLDVAPHPNEQHDFRITCLRCGERGALHISLIGPDEVVTIAPALRSPT